MRSLAARVARRVRSTTPADGAALLEPILKTDELPEYGVGATLYRHRHAVPPPPNGSEDPVDGGTARR